jgi:type II secretory pathway pseudopilin PulG
MNCRRANDPGGRRLPRRDGGDAAFTLIEVMVATAVLVISLASILLLVSTGIRTARIIVDITKHAA